MKKVLAFLMAMTMLVCLAVPSFADHQEHEHEPVNVVVVIDTNTPRGDVVKTGFGTAEQPVVVNDTPRTDIESVSAFKDGVAIVNGDVEDLVDANRASITVNGNVGEKRDFGEVEADHKAVVEVTKNVYGDVDADTGATVTVGNDVKGDVDADTRATVTVGGDVKGDVEATKGADVTVGADVEGSVTAVGKGSTVTVTKTTGDITALKGAEVIVNGEKVGTIDENGSIVNAAGDVIGDVKATNGEVTVGGIVTGSITETGAIVGVDGTVKGNITAIGGTVTAGDVEGDVKASNGAKVEIDEAVLKAVVEATDDNTEVIFKDNLAAAKITVDDGATVIVVGELSKSDVDIDDWKTEDVMETFRYRIGHGKHARIVEETKKVEKWVPSESELIVGKLGRDVDFEKGSEDSVFFLVGLDDAAWADLEVLSGLKDVDSGLEDVDKEYKATTASLEDLGDRRALRDATITFKAADGKELVGLDPEMKMPQGAHFNIDENGVATIRFDRSFRGGLQDLMLVLKDIAKVIPGGPTFYVEYGSAPVKSGAAPTVVSLTGAAGAEEYEGNGHVGLTFSAEYLQDAPALSTVKVANDTLGEELTASQYSLQPHQDGSVTLALSNTYLMGLDAGDYQFTVTLGEDSFVLVINVPAAE